MTQTLTKEQQEAELAKMMAGVKELTESVPELLSRIKTVEKHVDRYKDVDPTNVLSQMEQLNAGFQQIKRSIASHATRHPIMGLPGLEDDAEKFSVLRAVLGVKKGGTQEAFESVNAGFEWEAMSQIRERVKASGAAVGIDSQGGFFVPDQVIPDVVAAIYTRSVFIDLAGDGRTRVSVIDGLVGNKVTIPKFESGVVAYWVGEEDDYAESKAGTGVITMNQHKLGILTKITNEMRRFQSYGFENLLRQDMIRAMAKKLDWTVAYGPGTDNAPRGITRLEGVQVYRAETGDVYDGLDAARQVSDWDGGELNFDGLDNMMGVLEDNDIDVDASYSTISAPRYFRRLRQLKIENYTGQTSGQPYLLGAPMIRDETMRGLIGDFDKTTQIPTNQKPGASIAGTTDSTNEKYGDVFAGNFSEIVLGRWSGIEIEDDEGRGKDFARDIINVKMRQYADVGHRQDKSVVVCPDAQMRN